MRGVANKRLRDRDDKTRWQPPTGWTQQPDGTYVPPDYQPTRWELPTPPAPDTDTARAEYLKCQRSLKYFALRYCWTLDSDDPSDIPTIRKCPAYPYLRNFFDSVQQPRNTHVEKSRQMLMSWAWAVVLLWDVLFHQNWNDLAVSLRAREVDDGGENSSPNSILGKVRFMHERLPPHIWMPFAYQRYVVRNPRLQSTIRGETGKGANVSRGPNYKRALIDEAAYVQQGETIFKGARQAAKNGTILNSTPNGKGNVFARIRFSITSTFLKLSYHWSEHPRKSVGLYCICGWRAQMGVGVPARDQFRTHAVECPRNALGKKPEMRSPWYDAQAQDMRPEDVASELDISYEKSVRGRVWDTFDSTRDVFDYQNIVGPRGLQETEDEYHERYLLAVLDPSLETVICWDFGVGDPTVMLLGQIVNDVEPRVRIVDELEQAGKSYDFFSDYCDTFWLPIWRAHTGNPAAAFLHYGDPAGKQRDSKLESWIHNLRTRGIVMITQGPAGSMMDWIDYVREQFRKGRIEVSSWCIGTIDAVSQYHFPTDDEGNPVPGDHKPVHDEWSHKATALQYLHRFRWNDRLFNREQQGVSATRMLGVGANEPTTETRIW